MSNIKFPCSICEKAVASNHRALFCNNCEKWVHIKCNFISPTQYDKFIDESDDTPWLCFKCISDSMPYQSIDNLDLHLSDSTGISVTEDELEILNVSLAQREKQLIKDISELTT